VNTESITAFISLGSNLGDPCEYLTMARDALGKMDDMSLVRISPVYHTEPQGLKDQPWFANQVVKASCSPTVTPWNLLRKLLAIEANLGRVRTIRWGPRVIDLDLLLFGSKIISDSRLILPHPRMTQRAFVLVPLLDIEPDLAGPDGVRFDEALERIDYRVIGTVIHQQG
jgi:2-amino-4-hydroxy-6-hydroxymethyldihydropteridine diphosphokinase